MADAIGRQAQLTQVARLGEAMQAAASRDDWDGLGEHTRALSPLLRALAAHGPWNAAERVLLERVHAQHDAAALRAAAAARALEPRLEEMRANKDGWIAYALHNDAEPGANHE
jgi:hypothetical protein